LSLFWYFEVGLRVCDIVVKKFTFAISSPDEFLLFSTQRPFDANNSLTVATNDRLGLYGSASLFGLGKLGVPYTVDEAAGSFRLSREGFNDSFAPFVAGQLQVTVQDESWPRTFTPYLSFCTAAGMTFALT